MEETIISVLEKNCLPWSDKENKIITSNDVADYFEINRETLKRTLERNVDKLNTDMITLGNSCDSFCEMKDKGIIHSRTPIINVLTPLGVAKVCFLTDGVKQQAIKRDLRNIDTMCYLMISSYFSEEFLYKKYQKEMAYLIDSVFYKHKVEHEKTIGVFRVDCLIDGRIVIECDERNHRYYCEEYEHKRESYLNDNGYTVLRYDTESDNMLGFLGVISDCIAKKGMM